MWWLLSSMMSVVISISCVRPLVATTITTTTTTTTATTTATYCYYRYYAGGFTEHPREESIPTIDFFCDYCRPFVCLSMHLRSITRITNSSLSNENSKLLHQSRTFKFVQSNFYLTKQCALTSASLPFYLYYSLLLLTLSTPCKHLWR